MPESSTSLNSFTFDAFISYNRDDRGFAAELERRLEKYRFFDPAVGHKRHLNVFRDEQDMVGNNYFESINQQLKVSRKLIVICSPAAARSEFVDDEVSRFIAEHGAENVIPLLLEGLADNELTTNKGSSEAAGEKAFPPALSSAMEMPLAIDYRGFEGSNGRIEGGAWQPSWFMLLAGILNMSREQVERRVLKRRRKVLVTAISILSGVIVALSGLTVWALWQQSVARKQTSIAMSQQLGALSRTEMETDISRALLYSAKAVQFAQTPQAIGALITNLTQTDTLQTVLHGHPTEILDITISGNRSEIAAAGSCETVWSDSGCVSAPISRWSLPTGALQQSLDVQRGNIWSLAYKPDGTELVSLSDDGSAVLWDLNKNLAAGFLEVTVDYPVLLGAAFDSEEHILISDNAGYRLLQRSDFKPDLSESHRPANKEFYYDRKVSARQPPAMMVRASGKNFEVVIANSGHVSYSIPDSLVPLFESLELGMDHEEYWTASVTNPVENAGVQASDISADGRWIAVATRARSRQTEGWLFVIDTDSQTVAHEIPLTDFTAISVAISPDGKQVAVGACADVLIAIAVRCRVGEISVWDIETGHAIAAPLARVIDRPSALKYSGDGKLLAAGSCTQRSVGSACEGSQIIVWSTDSATMDPDLVFRSVSELTPAEAALEEQSRALSFPVHAGLRVEFERRNSVLKFFHQGQTEPFISAEAHKGGIRTAIFSADGTMIASGGDDATVKIWNRSGELIHTLAGEHTSPVYQLAFSADGQRLASADYDQSVILWDVDTWHRVGGFIDNYDIAALTFGYHSRLIATLSGYEVTLWDADRGLSVATLASGFQGFPRLEFSEEGVLELTFKTHRVQWNLDASRLISLACKRANRELRSSEWDIVSSGLSFEPICAISGRLDRN